MFLVVMLSTIFSGIVLVTKSNFFVSGVFEPPQECLSQSDGYKKWSCFRPYFERITHEISANAAMAEAIKFEVQREVSDCHLFGHYIGETTLKKNTFDMVTAFSSCTPGCLNACYHGVMEGYLSSKVDLSNLPSELVDICDSVSDDFWEKRRCIHGIGHGLGAHDYLSITDAINTCEAFDGYWEATCVGGLAMENMDQYLSLDLYENDFRELIPQICASFKLSEDSELDPKQICMEAIALGLLYYSGYDREQSKELCEEFTTQKDIDMCKEQVDIAILTEVPSNIDFKDFF